MIKPIKGGQPLNDAIQDIFIPGTVGDLTSPLGIITAALAAGNSINITCSAPTIPSSVFPLQSDTSTNSCGGSPIATGCTANYPPCPSSPSCRAIIVSRNVPIPGSTATGAIVKFIQTLPITFNVFLGACPGTTLTACPECPVTSFTCNIQVRSQAVVCLPDLLNEGNIRCRPFNLTCNASSCFFNGTSLEVDISVCKEVQIEAEVKLEVDGVFAQPRAEIPVPPPSICLPVVEFPSSCDFYPIPNCTCQGSLNFVDPMALLEVTSGTTITTVAGESTIQASICPECNPAGSFVEYVFRPTIGTTEVTTFRSTTVNAPTCFPLPGAIGSVLDVNGVGTLVEDGITYTNVPFALRLTEAPTGCAYMFVINATSVTAAVGVRPGIPLKSTGFVGVECTQLLIRGCTTLSPGAALIFDPFTIGCTGVVSGFVTSNGVGVPGAVVTLTSDNPLVTFVGDGQMTTVITDATGAFSAAVNPIPPGTVTTVTITGVTTALGQIVTNSVTTTVSCPAFCTCTGLSITGLAAVETTVPCRFTVSGTVTCATGSLPSDIAVVLSGSPAGTTFDPFVVDPTTGFFTTTGTVPPGSTSVTVTATASSASCGLTAMATSPPAVVACPACTCTSPTITNVTVVENATPCSITISGTVSCTTGTIPAGTTVTLIGPAGTIFATNPVPVNTLTGAFSTTATLPGGTTSVQITATSTICGTLVTGMSPVTPITTCPCCGGSGNFEVNGSNVGAFSLSSNNPAINSFTITPTASNSFTATESILNPFTITCNNNGFIVTGNGNLSGTLGTCTAGQNSFILTINTTASTFNLTLGGGCGIQTGAITGFEPC